MPHEFAVFIHALPKKALAWHQLRIFLARTAVFCLCICLRVPICQAAGPDDTGRDRLLAVTEFSATGSGRLLLHRVDQPKRLRGNAFDAAQNGRFTRLALPVPDTNAAGSFDVVLRWDTTADSIHLRKLVIENLAGEQRKAVDLPTLHPLLGCELRPDASAPEQIILQKTSRDGVLGCQMSLEIPTPSSVIAPLPRPSPPGTGSTALRIFLGLMVCVSLTFGASTVLQIFRQAAAKGKASRKAFLVALGATVASLSAWLLTLLRYFHLGGIGGVGLDLDSSWCLVLEYGAQHHLHHGQDLVYTYGPFGYLSIPMGLGGFLLEREGFAWIAALFAASLVWATCREVPGLMRWVLWLWLLLFPPTQVLLAAMAGTYLITCRRAGVESLNCVAIVAIAAIMSLTKFTDFLAYSAVIGAVALHHGLSGRWRTALAMPALFGIFLAFGWLAADQPLSTLLTYVKNSLQISQGYNTMALSPAPGQLTAGLLLAGVVLLTGLCGIILATGDRIRTTLRVAMISACAYVSWKHGYVRADQHVVNFLLTAFPYVATLALVTPLSSLRLHLWLSSQEGAAPSPQNHWQLPFLTAPAILSLALSFYAFQTFPEEDLSKWLDLIGATFMQSSKQCLSTLNGSARLPQTAETQRPDVLHGSLPEITRRAGRRAVDMINDQCAYAILNGLRYEPRPVFQSFSAYTPALQQLNLNHYLSKSKPDCILYNPGSIDGRYLWLNDGPLMLHILTDWRATVREKDFLLLEPLSGNGATRGSWQRLSSHSTMWNRKVKLPPLAKGRLQALVIAADRTAYGKMKQFLYQPGQADIQLKLSDGTTLSHVFIPELAHSAFLINPYLLGIDEVLEWQSGITSYKEVTTFKLIPKEGCEKEFADRIHYDLLEWSPSDPPQNANSGDKAVASPFPYLPAVPSVMKPVPISGVVNDLEGGCMVGVSRIEIPLSEEVIGLRGRYLAEISPDLPAAAKATFSVRVLDSQGQEEFHHDEVLSPEFGNTDSGEHFLDLDFALPASDKPRRLILETSTNVLKAGGRNWWGPLVWKYK